MLQNTVEKAQCIAIFGHDNPDGDAIGSMLGLGRLLEKMGKKVFYFASPTPSKIFDFIP
jgi:phosphoesterase RecJ-like protein